MATIIRRYPNLIVGLIALLLWAVAARFGDGVVGPGLGDLALFLVLYALGWPFWFAEALVRAFLGDSALVPVLSIPIGLVICALADWRLHQWRSARVRERAA